MDTGGVLTAADVLSLAWTRNPEVFVYYSKPWDFLIAGAIVDSAGVTVEQYNEKEKYDNNERKWKPVFKEGLDLPLIVKKAREGKRVLFYVRA